MEEKPQQPHNRIEKLNRDLYVRNESKLRKMRPGVLTPESFNANKEWKEEPKKEKEEDMSKIQPSHFKKFFIGALIFFLIAIGFAVFKFFGGTNTVSSNNIEIAILGNAFTPGGEELTLQVQIKNENPVPIEFANLKVEYARSNNDFTAGNIERKTISIGTIGSGKVKDEELKLVLFGEQGSTKTIKSTLEYRVRGSSAIFIKEKEYNVNISSAPLTLTVTGPMETAANQEITLDFKTVLSAPEMSGKTYLKVDYPPGFQFKEALPKPILGNNIWELAELKQGIEQGVKLKGSIIAQDGEERSFRAYVGERNPKDESQIEVIYSSLLHTIEIKKPFLEVHLLVNGEEKDEYNSDMSTIRGEIQWTNNLPTKIDNVEIFAKFSGSAFSENELVPLSGFYDSANDQIIWDRNTVQDFASIQPGESGKMAFSLKPAQAQIGTGSPQIVIELSMKGNQPSQIGLPTEVKNSLKKVIKINSDFQIAGQARYFTGPFQNTGPIPPKADQPTTYTITWTLTNSANKIVNAQAKTSLPTYVTWVGATSPLNESVTYDNSTREVTWNIGTVNPATGTSGNGREASFQVKLIPSITQIGSAPLLIDKTTLTGQDGFTGSPLKSVKTSVNTRLTNDPGFNFGDEKVVE